MAISGVARRQVYFAVLGAGLIMAGLLLPHAWYDALPTNPDVPPQQFSGVTLFRWVLCLQGSILIGLGWFGFAYRRLEPHQRVGITGSTDLDRDISPQLAAWLLCAVTLLALVLRCFELGSDFWIDEVRATLDAREMSTLTIFGSYIRSNVHMLNTFLMKLSMGVFGESEWAARLPAVLFGVATVPAVYWSGLLVTSRGTSLGAALLLAVSYHHVFFSQNARGYSLYLFFSVVSATLLVHALRDDQPRTWTMYVAATVLNFASILISGFVFAAHIVVGAIALVVVRSGGRSPWPLGRRLVGVFGVAALLGFQLYSVQLPGVISYINATYASPSTGYVFFSIEFVREMARGLGAGFGPGLLLGAIPLLVLAGIGCLEFVRRQWTLAASLALPLVLTAAVLLLRGLTVSPRFFLLGLPVAVLTTVLTLDVSTRFITKRVKLAKPVGRSLATTIVLLLATASVASLGPYYSTPKQPYRAALRHAMSVRSEGQIIVAVHAADRGSAYYAPEVDLLEGHDLILVNSVDELDAALAMQGATGAVLLTTMPRALRLNRPSLATRIADGWVVTRTLAGTIGDGAISVWLPKGG